MRFCLEIFLFFYSIVVSAEKVYRLRELNIDQDWITLSGFSSGGTFAQQLQISHSRLFRGIAVFSHTFYRCGPPNGLIDAYDAVCTKLGMNSSMPPYDVMKALADIQMYNEKGLIDDPNNLRDTRLYVFAGTKNSLFTTDQSLKILDIYTRYIRSPPEQISTRIQSAELVLPTKDFGGACDSPANGNFFLANCGFSGAYESLNYLYGGVLRKPRGHVRLQPIDSFNQSEFIQEVKGRADMDSLGYIYVPTGCRFPNSFCLLHLYFHGCLTGREFNGTEHVLRSGFLEVAEENHIIMIFPQAHSSPQNDIGCWDTFGVTGPLYATKNGTQIMIMKKILDKILIKKSGEKSYLNSGSKVSASSGKGHQYHGHTSGKKVPKSADYTVESGESGQESNLKNSYNRPEPLTSLVGHGQMTRAMASSIEVDTDRIVGLGSSRNPRGHMIHHEDTFMPSRGPFYSNAISFVTETPLKNTNQYMYNYPWPSSNYGY